MCVTWKGYWDDPFRPSIRNLMVCFKIKRRIIATCDISYANLWCNQVMVVTTSRLQATTHWPNESEIEETTWSFYFNTSWLDSVSVVHQPRALIAIALSELPFIYKLLSKLRQNSFNAKKWSTLVTHYNLRHCLDFMMVYKIG